jgi:hypothetical protein
LAAYFTGTILVGMHMTAQPVIVLVDDPRFKFMPGTLGFVFVAVFVVAIGVFLWAFLFKCAHSYLHLLRHELAASRRTTLGLWFCGTFLFALIFCGLLVPISLLLAPAIK